MSPIRNWAGNVEFRGPLHRPSSLADLQALVAELPSMRPFGTAHSFNRIADGAALVTVADLPHRLVWRPDGSVLVSGGLRYGELAPVMNAHGRALHNLGSLPHISVAGACATGTHGSGTANRCLAAAVRAVEIVTADGSLLSVARGDARFPGSVVALGALGLVTALVLDTEPTYQISQTVYENIPLAAVADSVDDLLGGGYSVSLFTRWETGAAWVKRRGPSAPSYFGFPAADGPRHPIPTMSPQHCTAQLGEPGPWHERLPHFRLDFTPSAGNELQSEYLVDASEAAGAIRAVAPLKELLRPVLQVSEIRAVAAGDLWLSPAYGRDSVALHFTWTDDWNAVLPVVLAVETALEPFDPRPHWGKVFTMTPATVAGKYPRFDDFRTLAADLDPHGKFRNDFLAPYFR